MLKQVTSAFAAGGALAKHIAGFNARDAQLQMAQAVADVIEHPGALVVEAGTGTGKTYAYLVPALLAGPGPRPRTTTSSPRRGVVSSGNTKLA